MASVEIDGDGIRFVDTTAGRPVWGPSLVASVTSVEQVTSKGTLASGGTLTVPFGNVAAGKALCIRISAGPATVTYTNNSVSSGAQQFNPLFLIINSSANITAAEVSQSTGSDITVETFVSGST